MKDAVLTPEAVDDILIDAVVLSACADGMSKIELEAIAHMAKELPSLAGRDHATVTDRIRQSFERLERDGFDGRLKSFAEAPLSDETRRRVFCAAAVIQRADGHVTNEENAFLLDLADVLGLDEPRVRQLVTEIERRVRDSGGA
jgi:tellurite resistance protein